MIAPTSFFADYGCHVRILEEIRALHKRGHQIRLCTYHNGQDQNGIDIHRTIDIPWRKRPVVGSSKHKIYLDIALFGTALRQARSFQPDVIHAHLHEGALIGSALGRLTGIPTLFDYQGSLTEEMLDHGFLRRYGLRHRFFRWLEKRIDTLPALIMPSSLSGKQFLLSRGVFPEQISLLDDAVNTEFFNPAGLVEAGQQMRRQLGIPHAARVIVYLGLLAEYQGTPLLIEAIRALQATQPDIFVVIAGYPGVGRHAALAADLPVAQNVLFPGRIPYQSAPALLAAGDVAVAPKLSATEGNGKILNYMSMALPTAAIDNANNRALLGEAGYFAKSHEPGALAQAIACALQASPAVGATLRKRVQTLFSWDSRVLQLEEAYARTSSMSRTTARYHTSPTASPPPRIDD